MRLQARCKKDCPFLRSEVVSDTLPQGAKPFLREAPRRPSATPLGRLNRAGHLLDGATFIRARPKTKVSCCRSDQAGHSMRPGRPLPGYKLRRFRFRTRHILGRHNKPRRRATSIPPYPQAMSRGGALLQRTFPRPHQPSAEFYQVQAAPSPTARPVQVIHRRPVSLHNFLGRSERTCSQH